MVAKCKEELMVAKCMEELMVVFSKGIPKLEFDVVAPCTFTITCKKIYCQSL
jgi:hypothetical protein